MKALLKSKKGFTLAELVIAIAVMSVLLAAMTAVFAQAMGVADKMRKNTFADGAAVEITDYIEDKIAKANVITIQYLDGTDDLMKATSAGTPFNVGDDCPDFTQKGLLLIEQTGSSGGRIYDIRLSERYTPPAPATEDAARYRYADSTKLDTLASEANKVFLDDFYLDCTYSFDISVFNGKEDYINIKTTIEQEGKTLTAPREKNFFLLNHYSTISADTRDTSKKYIAIYYSRILF